MSSTYSVLRTLDTGAPDFEAAFGRLEHRRATRRSEIDQVVAGILADVRERGDAAVIEATARFDGFDLAPERMALRAEEIEKGAQALDDESRAALVLAAERIRRYHAHRVPASWSFDDPAGRLGQRVRALDRVAIYVPAFKAPLASTVLMLALPAAVAGVRELIMATSTEHPHPAILAAARLAGVQRIFRMGGAQAIGALAYGTEQVPRVDKIVGPGNAYVQAAKRAVFGEVAIDAEAGPSEVMIVADASAEPRLVAADLLAQAEHEEMASVVLATPSAALLRATLEQLGRQLGERGRQSIIRKSLAAHGAAILTRDVDEALGLANRYAAEHLQLILENAGEYVDRIEHAGAIFVGPWSPVPMGDYMAGPSHVLPTGGTARFFSVVGVEDFQRRTSVVELSRDGIEQIGPAAARLADLEGLDGHAAAVRARLGDAGGDG